MTKKPALFLLVAAVVFVLDHVTKYLIKASLAPFEVIRLLPFLNIVYVENTGSAFGMFKGLGNTFFVAVAFGVAALLLFLLYRERNNRLAYALLLGGAAGNLADRVARGYVVDFIDVWFRDFHWPAFNVADSALTVGITLLLVATLRSGKKTRTP